MELSPGERSLHAELGVLVGDPLLMEGGNYLWNCLQVSGPSTLSWVSLLVTRFSWREEITCGTVSR